LSPIEVQVLAQRAFQRLEGRAVTPEEALQVVAETVAEYGAGEVTEASAAQRLPETTGQEHRRAVAEHADALVPTLPGFSSGSPSAPAPPKRLHEMTVEERRAYIAAAGHRLLPGDEYGPPDPRAA
jgi:hypothetical protein